jgi:hypothetical protein
VKLYLSFGTKIIKDIWQKRAQEIVAVVENKGTTIKFIIYTLPKILLKL